MSRLDSSGPCEVTIRLDARAVNSTMLRAVSRPLRLADTAIRRSSVVEQVAVNHLVLGSNPSAGAFRFDSCGGMGKRESGIGASS